MSHGSTDLKADNYVPATRSKDKSGGLKRGRH